MFPYSDPVRTGLLGSSGALEPYHSSVRDQDHTARRAVLADSVLKNLDETFDGNTGQNLLLPLP